MLLTHPPPVRHRTFATRTRSPTRSLSRRVELIVLVLADLLALSGAVWLFGRACARWGWMEPISALGASALVAGWMLLFGFAGLYAERYASGRFAELVTLVKVTAFGALVVFFGYSLDRLSPADARASMLALGALVFGSVGTMRVLIRTVQRALILRGYGRHRAVVIGWTDRVEALYHDLARYPAAGIEIVGAVRLRKQPSRVAVGEPAWADGDVTVGEPLPAGDALPAGAVEVTAAGAPEAGVAELPRLLDRFQVGEVLIALGSEDHDYLDGVMRVCEGRSLALKLVPDFYTAVGGMARTEHTYGLPLIELLPQPIPEWERRTKRLADVVASAAVLVLGLPVWLALAALVKLSSPGPAIFRQERVGRGGRTFTMYKYRTMRQDAEAETGPVWATPSDRRVTPLGRWLRRARLDEVPQLWNVFTGEMSLVGPRPERPYFVDKLAARIPLYSRRHRVQPGITGLAQVKWRYDSDIEDVRQKLKYDLFYIENMSLQMDAKILLQTVRTALSGAGH